MSNKQLIRKSEWVTENQVAFFVARMGYYPFDLLVVFRTGL